jgi:hypothetical protein
MRTAAPLVAALVLPIVAAVPAARADDAPVLHEYKIDDSYSGGSDAAFQKLRWTVPNLMRQTMIDVAVRLGLDFRDGWQNPMTVAFQDGSPSGTENVLAYTALFSNKEGKAEQALVVNVQAYQQESFNFDKVLAHELIHAMINDAVGAEAAQSLPTWLHEGLAVYGADQGEQMMRAYVQRVDNPSADMFLNGLEGPHTAMDYLEDYLAIKYIHDRHGVNSLHNFVGEVIRRKGDIKGAIQYTCFEDWDAFQANARTFSENQINDVAKEFRMKRSGQPY